MNTNHDSDMWLRKIQAAETQDTGKLTLRKELAEADRTPRTHRARRKTPREDAKGRRRFPARYKKRNAMSRRSATKIAQDRQIDDT
jgi:hypothetical protein